MERSGADEPLLRPWQADLGAHPARPSVRCAGYRSLQFGGACAGQQFSRSDCSVGLRNNLSRTTNNVRGVRNSVSFGSVLPGDVQMTLSATTQHLAIVMCSIVCALTVVSWRTRGSKTNTRQVSLGRPAIGCVHDWVHPCCKAATVAPLSMCMALGTSSSGYANVGLSVDSQVGTSGTDKNNNDGLGVRLQVSVPLGGDRSLTSTARRQGRRSSIGAAFNERVDDTLNYELRTDSDLGTAARHAQGGLLRHDVPLCSVGPGHQPGLDQHQL